MAVATVAIGAGVGATTSSIGQSIALDDAANSLSDLARLAKLKSSINDHLEYMDELQGEADKMRFKNDIAWNAHIEAVDEHTIAMGKIDKMYEITPEPDEEILKIYLQQSNEARQTMAFTQKIWEDSLEDAKEYEQAYSEERETLGHYRYQVRIVENRLMGKTTTEDDYYEVMPLPSF